MVLVSLETKKLSLTKRMAMNTIAHIGQVTSPEMKAKSLPYMDSSVF